MELGSGELDLFKIIIRCPGSANYFSRMEMCDWLERGASLSDRPIEIWMKLRIIGDE